MFATTQKTLALTPYKLMQSIATDEYLHHTDKPIHVKPRLTQNYPPTITYSHNVYYVKSIIFKGGGSKCI